MPIKPKTAHRSVDAPSQPAEKPKTAKQIKAEKEKQYTKGTQLIHALTPDEMLTHKEQRVELVEALL